MQRSWGRSVPAVLGEQQGGQCGGNEASKAKGSGQ